MKAKPGKKREIHFSDDVFLNTLMNHSKDTVYFKDLDSKFLMNSREHLLQFNTQNPDDIIGKSDFDFFPKEFAQRSFEDEQRIIKTKKPITGIIEKLEKPDGSVVWFSASKYPFYDAGGHIIGTWGVSRVITELKEYEEKLFAANQKLEILNKELQEISVVDSLTGLYNRRHFYNLLKSNIREIEEAGVSSRDISLMVVDIDAFKGINDQYGHLAGDNMISHIAAIIKGNSGMMDVCFRYGGDEFVVLCMNSDLQKATQKAEKIRAQVEETCFEEDGQDIHITVSIGVANVKELDKRHPDKFVELADKRLYESKKQGRNRVSS